MLNRQLSNLVFSCKLSQLQGREMGIMSDLIHSGSLQYIDYIHVDWPTHKNVDSSNGTKIEDLAHQNFKYAFTFATQVNLYKFFFRKAIEVIQNLIYGENLNLERFTEITDLDDERHAFDIDYEDFNDILGSEPHPLPIC